MRAPMLSPQFSEESASLERENKSMEANTDTQASTREEFVGLVVHVVDDPEA